MAESNNKSMDKQEAVIKETTEDFLKTLGITASVHVEPEDEMFVITLETEESGMIIGRHGDILDALQLLLSLAVAKKLGTFHRISLEVGDYKKNRTAWLESMTMQTKQRVLDEGREILLPNLKAWERRVVHMMLHDDQDVVTESVGEGKERTLVIKPR